MIVNWLCTNRESLVETAGILAQEIAELSPLTVQGVNETIIFSRDHGVYAGLAYVTKKMRRPCPPKICWRPWPHFRKNVNWFFEDFLAMGCLFKMTERPADMIDPDGYKVIIFGGPFENRHTVDAGCGKDRFP